MFDIIVVGARCAGAPTALLLARKGYKVLLVDRATFPSDICHGHYIHRRGPCHLAEWGLLERVAAIGPAVTTMTFDLGDFPLVGTDLCLDGVAFGYGPRRSLLDALLIDAAIEAGVEFRSGVTVDGFTTDGDRVTGIRARTSHPRAPIDERATVVVGADGRHSGLARFVGAAEYNGTPAVMCWYWSYWSGVADPRMGVYIRPDKMIIPFPTSDGLYAVFVGWPIQCFTAVRRDIDAHFMAAVDAIPEMSARVGSGRREERFYGAADLPNFFRKPYGPGWALVGDAGLHKDPCLALGICDAFRDVEFLVDALDAGLSGQRPMIDALAEYERRRNEATTAEYNENLAVAQFQPFPDEVYRLRAALRGNAEATRLFMLVRNGRLPREAFFNPENLGRLMG
jgi:2-polyprenyl-6-methoxyphenol hydroxylase-like FAD-dependent oxidoreductase